MKQTKIVEFNIKVTIELDTDDDETQYSESEINNSFDTFILDVENTLDKVLGSSELSQGYFSIADIELTK